MQTHIKRSGLTSEFKLWVDEIKRYTKAIYFLLQRGGEEEEEKYMLTFITAYPCPSICTRETPVLLCESSSVSSDMDCTDNDSLNQKWEYSVLDWTVG